MQRKWSNAAAVGWSRWKCHNSLLVQISLEINLKEPVLPMLPNGPWSWMRNNTLQHCFDGAIQRKWSNAAAVGWFRWSRHNSLPAQISLEIEIERASFLYQDHPQKLHQGFHMSLGHGCTVAYGNIV
jgi:hypothetical protein